MTEVKFVAMAINKDREPVAISMSSFDKVTKTYNTYTKKAGWARVARRAILDMEEVLPSPVCKAFMESLVDDGVIYHRWQYQMML